MVDAKQMSQFWDQRYQGEEYAYGREPNAFFASQLEKISPGSLLLPGEGEGRNAVFAAALGWRVEAFDQSRTGQRKALALAKELNVKIDYRVCLTEDFPFKAGYYDAVGLVFFHTHPAGRKYLHRKIFDSLKPGGSLILEAFHKEQINRNSGGPRSLEMLFDEKGLASDFAGFKNLLFEKENVELHEGPFHQGVASVIRFHGRKEY